MVTTACIVLLFALVLPKRLVMLYRYWAISQSKRKEDHIEYLEELIKHNKRLFRFYIWVTHVLRALGLKFIADAFYSSAEERNGAIEAMKANIEKTKIERDEPFSSIEHID